MAALNRRDVLALVGAGLAAACLAPQGQAREIQPGLHEISGQDAATVRKVLAMLTAIPVGTGREITCYMSSLCSVCQAFFRDYPGYVVPGVAMRYVPTVLMDAESGAVERVLSRPDLATFRQFMARQFSDAAPLPFDGSVRIADAVTTPRQRFSRHALLIAAISFLFRRNGSPALGEGTPRFLFTTENGNAYMVVGTPTPEMFRDIIALK